MRVGIKHDEAARSLGSRRAILAQQAAHDHPAGFQHRHRRSQADAARALRQMAGDAGERRQRLRCRRVPHDRTAEALQIVVIVEVGDQNVALLDRARRDWRVRILVTTDRHRRRQRGEVVDAVTITVGCRAGDGGPVPSPSV